MHVYTKLCKRNIHIYIENKRITQYQRISKNEQIKEKISRLERVQNKYKNTTVRGENKNLL